MFLKQAAFARIIPRLSPARSSFARAVGPDRSRGSARPAMSLKFEQFVTSRFEYVQYFIAGGMIEGSDHHRSLSKKVLDLVSK